MIITKAEYNDLYDILKLQKSAFISEAELYNNHNIEPLTQNLDSIQTEFSNHVFLKAVCEDKIVGSIKAREENDSCRIGKLIVAPKFQNKGIGRKLLIAIEIEFPLVNNFHLFTGSKSSKNIKLYESIGYKKAEEFCDPKNADLILIKMVKGKK